MSSSVFRCLDDFENRIPPACSQIDSQRAAFFVAVLLNVLHSAHVRVGEIVHMNVIANAGAVRSRVVGPVDLQLAPGRGGGGKRQWNQVRLRVVEFADLAAFIGSRSVEIAQAYRAQSVGAAVSLERVFEKKLGRAIGIDRLARRLLRERNVDLNLRARNLPGDA